MLIAAYLLGFLCAIQALWRSRTPQGAAAWGMALITIPPLAIPLFFLFGQSRFYGYIKKRDQYDQNAQKELAEIESFYAEHVVTGSKLKAIETLTQKLKHPGITQGNQIELLINGEQTYSAMFEELEKAQKYILFQFYIFRSDEIGLKFAEVLKRKARQGVRVYFLCDKVGTRLKNSFIRDLESAGVKVTIFYSSKDWRSRMQFNFRNHRKVVVVDSQVAFVGGLNIGDDYLGKYKKMGPWRDTHMLIRGPAALATQVSFVKDWHWAKEDFLDLDWETKKLAQNSNVLVLHTGPSDSFEFCLLAHISIIQCAKERVWIACPYFVPPESLIDALSVAALNGVDVRVILPSYSDSQYILYASYIYVEKLIKRGVKFYRYMPGFLHEKVMLVDQYSLVGSVNLDPRSLFVNFEICAITDDLDFAIKMQSMFEEDFQHCRKFTLRGFEKHPYLQKLLGRAVNLFSPLL